MRRIFPLSFFFILVSCTPQVPAVDVEKDVVYVYADAFSEAWLPALYTCAERSPELLVYRASDIDTANIILRLNGYPRLDTPAYHLADVEFVVATNAQNPLDTLSLEDVHAIFIGKITNWAQLGWDDALIQIWGYTSETGLNGVLLQGEKLSSLAKQAQSPVAMRDAITADQYEIGFIPLEMVLSDPSIQKISFAQPMKLPLLILLREESDSSKSVVACLQRNTD